MAFDESRVEGYGSSHGPVSIKMAIGSGVAVRGADIVEYGALEKGRSDLHRNSGSGTEKVSEL